MRRLSHFDDLRACASDSFPTFTCADDSQIRYRGPALRWLDTGEFRSVCAVRHSSAHYFLPFLRIRISITHWMACNLWRRNLSRCRLPSLHWRIDGEEWGVDPASRCVPQSPLAALMPSNSPAVLTDPNRLASTFLRTSSCFPLKRAMSVGSRTGSGSDRTPFFKRVPLRVRRTFPPRLGLYSIYSRTLVQPLSVCLFSIYSLFHRSPPHLRLAL